MTSDNPIFPPFTLEDLKAERQRRKENKITQWFPDAGPFRRELYPKHLEFFASTAMYRETCLMAANRIGKALKHGTMVATPKGWIDIAEIKKGDKVIAGDGAITKVINVWPQGEVELHSLLFDGVYKIETCAEHLWKFQAPNARFPTRRSHGRTEQNPFFGQWKLATTAELGKFSGKPRQRVVIPMTKPFRLKKKKLDIDPYTMGLLLGDGSLDKNFVRFTTVDQEFIDYISKKNKVVKYQGYNYGINGLSPLIKKLGLANKNSSTKFIPDRYLFSNKKDRLDLLQGLMDTDGSIDLKSKSMEYSTCSDDLADGFVWLANSLGMKAKKTRRQTKCQNGNGLASWRIILRSGKICPFKLKRKVSRWGSLKETSDWIVHSVKKSERGMATCIEVDHPSHTFVIENGIVTHNSEAGAFAVTCHLTGNYPAWWIGKRFKRPVSVIVAGESGKLVRDSVQKKLMGEPSAIGTGMIPKNLIVDRRPKSGIPDAIDTVRVKHSSGLGESNLIFMSFDQGREAFQATERDVIWLDEECPLDVYAECVIRTMTTQGIVMMTFTPLKGVTDTVLSIQKKAAEGTAAIITATWDDAPHLSEKDKDELMASLPPHQRDARSKGVPQLGSGAIYPVPESEIVCDPFDIPRHFFRVYGLDVGWNATAAAWLAIDTDKDIMYMTHDYKRGQAEPAVHASAIRARGAWIPGVIDPASRGRAQKDGEALIDLYREQGLILSIADNAVEAGIFDVYERLTTGRLKIFKTCTQFLEEYRLYRRDDKGKVVKENDHIMDGIRYAVRSGIRVAQYEKVTSGGKGQHVHNYNPLDKNYAAKDFGNNSGMSKHQTEYNPLQKV